MRRPRSAEFSRASRWRESSRIATATWFASMAIKLISRCLNAPSAPSSGQHVLNGRFGVDAPEHAPDFLEGREFVALGGGPLDQTLLDLGPELLDLAREGGVVFGGEDRGGVIHVEDRIIDEAPHQLTPR